MQTRVLDIGGRPVGMGHPCFVIAEAGVNHNGDLQKALELIDVAAEAGADAVKFQTFSAERLVTAGLAKAEYQVRTTGAAESQYEMLKRLELPLEAHPLLMEHCRRRGIAFMSTPFDEASIDFLDGLGVAVFKSPSGEITNVPYLQHLARAGRPMIVSTGMSSLGEVESAVEVLEQAGNVDFVLLHCVSNYPADPADANLRAMQTLHAAFGCPVGYSDHTLGIEVGLAAVAMGACVLEKHFTLNRTLPGPDHAASLEPDELARLLRGIRTVESAIGTGRKALVASEAGTRLAARKCLVAASDIAAGSRITIDTVAIKRAGDGLPPAMRPHLLDRTARRDIPAGTPIDLEMLS